MSAEPAPDVCAVAEALGIPWRRILASEIESERTLRRILGEAQANEPLWRILCALPSSALDSWRVRERVNALACEAGTGCAPSASRELKEVFDHLRGKRKGRRSPAPMASHFWFAYQRVQELVSAAGGAEKMRGDRGWRVRRTAEVSGCSAEDARWAVDRAEAPRRGHRLDEAIARARFEGFEIPRAGTPLQSFVLLRKLARKNSPVRSPRSARPRRAPRVVGAGLVPARDKMQVTTTGGGRPQGPPLRNQRRPQAASVFLAS